MGQPAICNKGVPSRSTAVHSVMRPTAHHLPLAPQRCEECTAVCPSEGQPLTGGDLAEEETETHIELAFKHPVLAFSAL
jgi:hypothetical protein